MSKFKDNIPGFPGYHVTKNGDVYSMKCKVRDLVGQFFLRKAGEGKPSIIRNVM